MDSAGFRSEQPIQLTAGLLPEIGIYSKKNLGMKKVYGREIWVEERDTGKQY